MPMVSVKDAVKKFLIGGNSLTALGGVSIEVEAGEFLAIAGPSGSGKSTLLNLIGCIEKPDSGRIVVDGEDVSTPSLDALASIRARKIGYIFQTFNLLSSLTVSENIEYPLFLVGLPGRERQTRVQRLLKEVGLERFARHRPRELSGGQRQRVAIARALAGSPAIVLADEPTANLDHDTGVEIISLMKNLNEKMKTTFIFSTHDPKIISTAKRTINLSYGVILPPS